MFAIGNSAHNDILGEGITANQLNHDVDFRVIDHVEHVISGRRHTNIAGRVQVTSRNLRHINTTPRATSNFCCVTLQDVKGATANGAQTTDAYFDRFQTLVPTLLSSRIHIGLPGSLRCPSDDYSLFSSAMVANCCAG